MINKGKSLCLVLFFISIFLTTSTAQSLNQTDYAISLQSGTKANEEQLVVQDLDSERGSIKKLPSNYISQPFFTRRLRNAIDLEFFIQDQFNIDDISRSDIHDLAVVHYAIAYIDLYFTTLNPFFLDQAHYLTNQTLDLLVNDTLIAEDISTEYKVDAYENLYLILLYQRLAKAYADFGDQEFSNYYWGQVNSTMEVVTDVFYNTAVPIINQTIYADISTQTVTSSSPYTSAKVVGLYALVSHSMQDRSQYHAKSFATLSDYYFNNSLLVSVDLGEGFNRLVYLKDTNTSDTIDLTGNMLLSAALLQESAYQKILANETEYQNYFIYGQWLLEDINAVLFNPSYDLCATSYNNATQKQSTLIYTFENANLAMLLREFGRFHIQRYGFSPGNLAFGFINSVVGNFKQANLFDAGLSTNQGTINYKIEEYETNPVIVNAFALSMSTKYYPMLINLGIPDTIFANETTTLIWELFWKESQHIFDFSNESFEITFDLDMLSSLNITTNETLTIKTHMLDGIKINNFTTFNTTMNAVEGGEYTLSSEIILEDSTIFQLNNFLLYVQKELRVYTDPTNIQATQGIDDYLEFSIICEDEISALVSDVNLELTLADNITTVKTDSSGSYDVKIPLQTILNLPEFTENPDENPRINFDIFAYKEGYIDTFKSKVITVRRNSLTLELSKDLSVKQGNDITLTLSVTPQIQTLVVSPKATIYINDEEVSTTTSFALSNPKFMPKMVSIPLPTQVTLPTSKLKEDAVLKVVVESGNFPTQDFIFDIEIIPLNTFEAIYQFLVDAFSSTWVKVLGSLSVVWAVLFKQFSLYVLKRLQRCPYCGETMKRKYSVCRYCGNVIDKDKYKDTLKEEKEESTEVYQKEDKYLEKEESTEVYQKEDKYLE